MGEDEYQTVERAGAAWDYHRVPRFRTDSPSIITYIVDIFAFCVAAKLQQKIVVEDGGW